MLIKSHEQLNQAVCETFFSSQLSKMGLTIERSRKNRPFLAETQRPTFSKTVYKTTYLFIF